MGDFITYEKIPERAVLIAVASKQQGRERTEEYLDELAFLLETAGGIPVARFVQPLDRPSSVTYLGSGKLEEIHQYIKAENIEIAVIDDELSATQARNMEQALECRVLDRTSLILDIFASNAHTAHAKAQVELAQYQYLLPRLTRMWTHLERQRGGIGMRGPGETQIETDRRLILERIALLKQKLKEIDMQKTVQRKNRSKLVRVALVGYTNVGKSTIMNLLSKSEVYTENKLFATLDTTVRKVVVDNLPFLLSDTVGLSESCRIISWSRSSRPWMRCVSRISCCMWSTSRIPTSRHRWRWSTRPWQSWVVPTRRPLSSSTRPTPTLGRRKTPTI